MLNVFITIDTEVYPRLSDWRKTGLAGDVARDIYGSTAWGEFGLTFNLRVLNEFGLKACFFVESIFASAVGLDPLSKIVHLIASHGHEVQLHVHTEWLAHVSSGVWKGESHYNIRDYCEEDQTELIALGLRNLRESGASGITAFRAGNYGANLATLRALAHNGIRFDSSYNFCYLYDDFHIPENHPLLQPYQTCGVWEFPCTFFSDYPGHHRHCEVTACSYAELTHALMSAYKQNWHSFVIIHHPSSMNMLKRSSGRPERPDRMMIRRFRRLCEFLASHPDKFRTATFNEIGTGDIPVSLPSGVIASSPFRTMGRIAQQGVRRICSRILK